jgi:hypothetical protein
VEHTPGAVLAFRWGEAMCGLRSKAGSNSPECDLISEPVLIDPAFSRVLAMIEDEAALLADVRFPLRGLDPWPPKGNRIPPANLRGRWSSI